MRSVIKLETNPVLAKEWAGDEVSFSLMIPDLVNPSDWQDWWKATLFRDRPTVVLADSVFQAIYLHNFCLANGIHMPNDISIVALEDADFLEWLSPLQTRYRYQNEKAFRHFRLWMRGGYAKGSLKLFGAGPIQGETLGPAPVNLAITHSRHHQLYLSHRDQTELK